MKPADIGLIAIILLFMLVIPAAWLVRNLIEATTTKEKCSG